MDADKDKIKGEEIAEEIQRIRMTLRGREVKPLEEACSQIVSKAKKLHYKAKGPVRIPTKNLNITVRRSPCGNVTNTFDRFEMHIHKRYIDIFCPVTAIQEITNFKIDAGVDVNMTLTETQ